MSFGIFSTDYLLFEAFGYHMSLIEFLGTVTGLISVWYATRTGVLTWPAGIINAILLFVFFYQLRLYSDMFLQVYFFVVCVYGWWKWKDQSAANDDHKVEWLSRRWQIGWAVLTAMGAGLFGLLILHLHDWLPRFFPAPAAFPFLDSIIAVMSISAILLQARKKVESWILWILVDVLAIFVYGLKDVYFLASEYIVFLVMASYGFYQWKKAA